MKIECPTLEERIAKIRKEIEDRVKMQIEAEKIIDFIRFQKGFREIEGNLTFTTNINTGAYVDVTIHISEVPLEFIYEKLLGPLHRKYGMFWELKIGGSEEEPVFNFRRIHIWRNPDIQIQAKEGAFKSCKITKTTEIVENIPSKKVSFQMDCS